MANDKLVTKRGIYLYINGQEIKNDVKSVRSEMQKLINSQSKMTIGSNQYVEAGKKIKALDSILKEHRAQWRATSQEIDKAGNGFSIGKLSDAFNRYMGIVTAFIASITGITFAVRKCIDDFATLEEEQSNVRKYTGMTTEQVKELNESFKNMDTRAARTQLNQLAADAGRLGISGKEDILEFVDAANIIKVSLGEDLGEKAVQNIGKLSEMFGLTNERGLRAGMLAVASAVNEIGANSAAAESYIVDFTARVAGTGNQAGIAIPKIMGYASVLDQNMIRNEMAATALQKVWLMMYQKPAEFAKLAGQSVEDFTNLVLNDANEAFLQLLSNLSKSGGLMQLAPIFDSLKLDGTEAIGVMNTLVANVSKIRKEQEIATKAFDEGTSVIEEYNVQNNTLQATIEKAKNKFQEYSYTLGEQLAPYMSDLISKSGLLLNVISVVLKFLTQYGTALAKTIIVLAAYSAGLKLAAVWNERNNLLVKTGIVLNTTYRAVIAALAVVYNLLRGRLMAAQVAMVAFNQIVKANPLGLLLSLVTAVGAAIYSFTQKQKEANKYTRQMKSEILEEETACNRLFVALKAAGQGTEQRNRLIEIINQKYGEYLPKLLTEESTLNDIRKAQDSVNAAIRTNIALKTQQEAVDDIEQKSLEKKASDLDDIRNKLSKKLPDSEVELALSRIVEQTDRAVAKGLTAEQALKGVFTNLKNGFFGGDIKRMDKQTANELEDYIDTVYDTVRKISEEKAKYKPFIVQPKNVLPEISVTGRKKGNDPDSYTLPGPSEKELKKALDKELQVLENSYKEQTVAIKRQYIQRKISEEEMQREIFGVDTLYLQQRKDLYEKYGENTLDIQNQITDKIIAEAERRKKSANKIEQDPEKPEENQLYESLAEGLEVQIQMNESLYQKGLISHEEYLRRKAELDEQYRAEKAEKDKAAAEQETRIRESVLSTISNFANSAASVLESAQQKEINAIEKRYKTQLLLAEGNNEQTAALEEQKEAEINEVKKKYASKTFAMNVLQITADTAVAAMRAYSAMAGIPVVGPGLGIAAAAAAVAAGAAQIAVAKQQQEQVMNMWNGGFTGPGGKYEKKKLIQTHGGEFVANKETVQILRPVFDIMDYAQRTGNVAALTSPEMAAALGSGSSYSSVQSPKLVSVGSTASTNPDIARALNENTRVISKLVMKLDDPFVGEVYIDGPRGVKRNMDDYEKLIKNASR